ncbi:ribosomal protein S18-alanine N-acetyltransferase [Futiania mangrovi]|uniref:Ribosomal protein S18-alanine N-acetyltransferase n=1 Tax=Futiania mangrovi TaxID=2959716 RepID=A0A9J6PIN6_9PROT|nr:ribosomal protein S18-alanine N-acetyltransferase [Futiania mangrovii]MCP1336415.1 ribosomal protein S18-alanine N-acetyltransferase [Futiania mangrovii]
MPPSRPERLIPVEVDATEPETAAALARLHALSFPEDPWTATAIAGLAAGEGCAAVALQEAETLAGFALVRTVLDEAELLTICVQPDRRGRGGGATLLRAACTAAYARGARRLFLEVAADNGSALALYSSAGLALTGRRKNYYVKGRPDPADAHILSASLPLAAEA